ncbi:MAG: ribosome small subunit-dependent GTPase A [Halobacteriovorax sp.]|nr:ribosome small subunit-dependent GTPase A [Halobacteriovorax sp.]
MIRARIIKSDKRVFDCRLIDSGEFVQATALGNLFKEDTVVVGDYVLLEAQSDEWVIKEVEARKSEIFRMLRRESKRKVTAANCDSLVILNSSSKPAYKRGIVDRFLTRAHQWGVVPFVVFNKMDEYDPKDFDIKFEADRLQSLGVKCFEICAVESDYKVKYLSLGIEDLKRELNQSTSIFLGQSGVGKSQTITAITDGKTELKTGAVGKVGKGSHTTTWSEIIDCGNFELIDSPGIRQFSIDDIASGDLIELFPDVEEVATGCSFTNCGHESNNKGCAFYSGKRSEYERELILSRLDSYKQLLAEISQIPDWQKKSGKR